MIIKIILKEKEKTSNKKTEIIIINKDTIKKEDQQII